MLEGLRGRVMNWPGGRWSVLGGLAVGIAFLGYQAFSGDTPYGAFVKGGGAAALVMVLSAVAQRLWVGDKVESAQLPGGVGAQFESSEAATKTRESVENLNERVTAQAEQMITMQAQLDKRVSDLERAAFKAGPSQPDRSA